LGREKRGETIVGLIIFTSLQLDKGSSCSQTSQLEGGGGGGGERGGKPQPYKEEGGGGGGEKIE